MSSTVGYITEHEFQFKMNRDDTVHIGLILDNVLMILPQVHLRNGELICED